MDYDDDKGRRRFMVNRTSTMHVPEIICLDDDDDDDDEQNRSEVKNEYPRNNRISQQRKRKTAEISRASSSLVVKRESIERDNRAAERRKRKLSLLATEQDNIFMSGSKVESLRDAPIVRAQESIQGDNRVRKIADLKAETSRRAVPFVRHQEDIQRDKKVMETDGFYVYTSSGVRLLRKKQQVISQGRKSEFSKLEPETSTRNVPLAIAEEDNVLPERRKRETVKTKAAGTSKVVPVSETSRIVHETQRNKGNKKESVAAVDINYMAYLKWLVDSAKDSKAKHVVNQQNDPSELDPPVLATPKESTVVPVKELLVNVKVEQEQVESWSDDSDIIAVSGTPFLDGEDTPFVASKSAVDLEEESKENESMFTKELMDALKEPYDEEELLQLSNEASVQKPVTRCRELRKGREKVYATGQMGQSYLHKFSDFEKEYKLVDGVDQAKALKLLRGFFFYLKNCSRDGAFKPWSKEI